MEIEQGALHLQFRDDAVTSAPPDPPDVAAFLRGAPLPAGPHIDDGVAVVPGTAPVDPDGPIVVFLQHPEFGIPAPYQPLQLPDLADWSVRPTTFGWIATVSPPVRGTSSRRAAQVLAGALAFSLTGATDALAAPPSPTASTPASTPAPVQAPASVQPPTTTRPATPAPANTKSSPPATATPPATTTSTTATTPAATPAPTTPTLEWTPPPMPPRVQVSTSVSDAAWEGVDGVVVVVLLKGGKLLQGRVGAVQAETFTLIDSTDGQILVVPKSGVISLRAYVPPPIPTQTGTGMLAGGSILVALGIPVFITGVTFVAICPSCTYIHIPMLVVGGGALGGGIPLLARGIQRRNAFQRAIQEHQISPIVSRTLHNGWTGGLQFRF